MTTRTPGLRSSRRFLAVGIGAALLLAVGAIGVWAPIADAGEHITVEMLTERAEFTDDVAAQIRFKLEGHGTKVINMRDASRIAVAEVTIQPGAVFPWHTHPGPVLITIAEGDFVYVLADDCVPREYTAGQALIDAGGDNIHTAYNPSATEETVVIATFLGVPAEGDLTVPVDGPDPGVCPLPDP